MKSLFIPFILVLSLSLFSQIDTNNIVFQIECATELKTPSDIDQDFGQVFYTPEIKPEFPGGELKLREYIATNLMYPEELSNIDIEGRIIVQFAIDAVGQVCDIEVLRGVHPSLDREALRLFKAMPRWKPGKNRNEKVKVKLVYPVRFK